MNVTKVAARTLIGGLFIGHGTQKLKGWFGGGGPDGTAQMMEQLQMHPPRQNAIAAGITETAGGALLTAGLATPVAASGLIGVMMTAVRKVHLPNGPWVHNGGYEYNLVLIAALATLAAEGPGRPSLDDLLHLRMRGLGWALGAVGLGAAASTATIAAAKRQAPTPPASAPSE